MIDEALARINFLPEVTLSSTTRSLAEVSMRLAARMCGEALPRRRWAYAMGYAPGSGFAL